MCSPVVLLLVLVDEDTCHREVAVELVLALRDWSFLAPSRPSPSRWPPSPARRPCAGWGREGRESIISGGGGACSTLDWSASPGWRRMQHSAAALVGCRRTRSFEVPDQRPVVSCSLTVTSCRHGLARQSRYSCAPFAGNPCRCSCRRRCCVQRPGRRRASRRRRRARRGAGCRASMIPR